MKYQLIIMTMSALALSACTTQLNEADRALLLETRQAAEEARDQARQAAADAKWACDMAGDAAISADKSARKSERIFQHGMDK